MINIENIDCMIRLKEAPDNYWDLAIVDPPYGMLEMGMKKRTNSNNTKIVFDRDELYKWDIAPPQKYFDELKRVSKNQIIWGGNYFTDKIPPSRCWICWNKVQFMPTYSKFELAWTSFKVQSELFKFRNIYPGKIHPTQKPVALYTWLLDKYAKTGDKILDTHLGSGSIALACHDMGFHLDGYELDEEYYNAAMKRLKNHQRQLKLF